MPSRRRSCRVDECLMRRSRDRWKLIETIDVGSFTQNVLSVLVLNKKGLIIKSNGAIVILSKFLDRDQIRRNLGRMKDMMKFERMSRSRKNAITCMLNRNVSSISNSDLITALIRTVEL